MNDEITEKFGVGSLIAHLAFNRGIDTLEKARIYFNPSIQFSLDFKIAKDVGKSLDVIVPIIEKKDKITIYGDYDVDGVTSTVILYKSLVRLGAKVDFYMPDRHKEGYGLNIGAVEKLAASGTKLLLTCDNGISAIDEIKRAKELGLNVIVIDHHEPKFVYENNEKKYIIPVADAVIDAKQPDCPYPFKYLCAAGMCYYYCEKVYERMGRNYNDIKAEMLSLAAAATICDMVELSGENRIIVRNGLKVINSRTWLNKGLNALLQRRNGERRIDENTFGFFVGPCINAAGRLKSGLIAVKLLIEENEEEAAKRAEELIALNEERKQLTEETYRNASEYIKANGFDKDNVIIADIESANQSVAGIAAGNLKERFNKPVIVISSEKDPATGSARSIEGYNIFEALLECSELFVKFGGHSQAAGLTIKKENIPLLRKALNANYNNPFYKEGGIIDIDFETQFSELTVKNVDELDIMRPLGMGNEAPAFSTHDVTLKSLRLVGAEKKVMQFIFYDENGIKMKGVSFSGLDKMKELLKDKISREEYENIFEKYIPYTDIRADIAYTADINEYNGFRTVQLHIKDMVIKTKP